MKLLIKLAWRNIWRNGRRSILTMLAICFATFASIAMRGVQLGTYAINIDNVANMFSGYLQIQKKGFQQNPSINKCFKPSDRLLSEIKSSEYVTAYSERIYADGLISFKENSFGAAIFGLDPNSEKNVTRIADQIHTGRFFKNDSTYEIVVGYKLLENLKANIGDVVVILSQGTDGSLGNLKFRISGTIKTGSPQFDEMGVFMELTKADELLAMYGRKHVIVIRIDKLDNLYDAQTDLKNKITNSDLQVLNWEEVMPEFKNSIEFDNISGIFYLFILLLIVAFGILNTVLMSITERYHEFGVTISIGMPQRKLVALVLLETALLTIVGIIFGNIIGYGINYYLIHNPIEFGKEIAVIYEEYGFLPIMVSSLKLSMFINTSFSVLAISFIAAIYPAYKLYKLEPLKGIRHT